MPADSAVGEAATEGHILAGHTFTALVTPCVWWTGVGVLSVGGAVSEHGGRSWELDGRAARLPQQGRHGAEVGGCGSARPLLLPDSGRFLAVRASALAWNDPNVCPR